MYKTSEYIHRYCNLSLVKNIVDDNGPHIKSIIMPQTENNIIIIIITIKLITEVLTAT